MQPAADLFDGPVEVVGAFDGDGGVGGGGENEEVGHGAGGGVVLVADALLGTATLADVTGDAAGETEVVGSVDVDAEVVEGAERLVVEGEDAFDDEDAGGGEGFSHRRAGVGGEVVGGTKDGLTGGEGLDVVDEEFVLDGVGMVEVLKGSLGGRKVGGVAVVEVEGKEGGIELRGELAGEGGLAGA